jgi:BlaI family transcriptional regulator, penicillinase repressor
MPAPRPEKLTRREREIMDVLFALGDRASAEDIRERLTDPPSYSAVRAMLAKLEAKGHIRHREEGLRYVYSPTTSRGSARRAALNQLVRVFFGGPARRDACRSRSCSSRAVRTSTRTSGWRRPARRATASGGHP